MISVSVFVRDVVIVVIFVFFVRLILKNVEYLFSWNKGRTFS